MKPCRFRTLFLTAMTLAFAGSALAVAAGTGSLVTSDNKGISGKRVRELLDTYIPTNNAHSTLVVLTQCYGGDMVDSLANGRANTAVISATSAGQKAQYGGYDDDAAGALKPGATTTSDDVHQAGTDGKHSTETPSKAGAAVSLEPVDTVNGPIKSRHVLVYAGKPDIGTTQDSSQRDKIKSNFAGQPGTSVTTVGGDGTGGWDHPGTEAGLKAALAAIKAQMNADEQFILFVTDHGDKDATDVAAVETPPVSGSYQSVPLFLEPPVYLDMFNEPNNEPVVTIFVEEFGQPAPCDIQIGTQGFLGIPFDTRVDLNNDGLQDPGDGWEARAIVNELQLDPVFGDIVTASNLPPALPLPVQINLSSGAIPKGQAPGACCLPNGDCQTVLEISCTVDLGGFFVGIETACTAPEACCIPPNDDCVMLDPLCCLALSGTPQGPGTVCTAPVACCFPDGTCQDLDPLCCTSSGGAPGQSGSMCQGDNNGNGIDDACETVIPAASDIGLVVLALLALAAGIITIRRVRHRSAAG